MKLITSTGWFVNDADDGTISHYEYWKLFAIPDGGRKSGWGTGYWIEVAVLK